MPTYKFFCTLCKKFWEESQLLGVEHTSACSNCQQVCQSVSFGGTGTLLKGRHMNKRLEGFPDNTNRINAEADREGDRMEKEYDAYVDEVTRKDDDDAR